MSNNNQKFWIRTGMLVVTSVLAFIAAQYLIDAIANKTIDRFTTNLLVIAIIVLALGVTFYIVLDARKLSNQVADMNDKLNESYQSVSIEKSGFEELSAVLSNLHQAVAIISRNDTIYWVNDSFEKLFGFTKEESLGSKVSDLLAGPETDRSLIEKMDEAIFKRNEPVTVKLVHYRKDKSTFWARVEITPVLDEEGNLEKYIAVSSDISDEHYFELLLKQSQANFKQITSTINSVTFLYNIDESKYEYISKNCGEILGAPSDFFHLGNDYAAQFVHPEDLEMMRAATAKVESGHPYKIEYRIIVNDEIKWVKEESFPIEADDNGVRRNSGICTDITERKHDQKKLAETHKELEVKSNEINDSIAYALRIQESTLSEVGQKSDLFPHSFVLNKPKDIVSGDFYRLDSIITSKNELLKGFIVGDCTGHGVPGAILSILCSSLIRQTLTNHDVHNVGDALNNVRENLQGFFNNSSNEDRIKDGMDAAFGVVHSETKMLYFAGANMNCYIVRDNEVIRIKGNRQHVGYDKDSLPFETHAFQLIEGDSIYVSTDGFLDQFGGPKSKKFGSKQFTEIIKESTLLPIYEREEFLMNKLMSWKNEEEQTDDICLLGIEID